VGVEIKLFVLFIVDIDLIYIHYKKCEFLNTFTVCMENTDQRVNIYDLLNMI